MHRQAISPDIDDDQMPYFIGEHAFHSEELIQLLEKDQIENNKFKLKWIIEQAIKHKKRGVISFLLSNGYVVDVLNDDGQTALHLAVYNEFLDIIDLLFAHCDTDEAYPDRYGLTHFHIACIAGNVKVVEAFLQAGVDLNIAHKCENFTPLHFAALHMRKEIVELLIEQGANVDAIDLQGRTALHLACATSKRFRELVSDTLLRDPDKKHTITSAIIAENIELQIVKLLIEHGSNINAKDRSGNTPMFFVFQNDNFKYTNIPNSITYFPYLDRVMVNELESKQREKLEFLLQSGADVTVYNDDGELVLHRAIDRIKLLRWPKDIYRNACFDDKVSSDMVDLLLRHGFELVNSRNQKGESPLQIAITVMSTDIVKVLLKYNADLSSVKFHGFHYPSKFPCLEATENIIEIVSALVGKGLKFSLEDNLVVLKFFMCSLLDCKYVEPEDENASDKIMNILEFGTTRSIRKRDFRRSWTRNDHVRYLLNTNEKISSTARRFAEPYRLGPQLQYECRKEVEIMMKTMLDGKTSLYDVVIVHPHKIYPYVRNGEYTRILRSDDFENTFDCCATLIKEHFTKGLVRRYILESAIDYFRCLCSVGLPDLCCENILNHLSNEELLNLCLAATIVTPLQKSSKPQSVKKKSTFQGIRRVVLCFGCSNGKKD